jgi:hypothetical protein
MKLSAFIQRLPAILKKPLTSEKWQRFGFALFSTLLIMVFVKIPIEKFNIEFEEGRSLFNSESFIYMADDLDNDGNSERIYCARDYYSERLVVMIYDYKGLVVETFNFIQREWAKELLPAAFDINDDGIKELLFITVKNDSVLFNAINSKTFKTEIHDFYLGTIERLMPQLAFRSEFYCFEDMNNDGEKELYFHFDAGFGLSPRGIYQLDIKNMELKKTPDSYIVWDLMEFADINKDGQSEMLVGSYSPMNVPFEAEFSDDRPYIAAFNLDMDYLFPPIPMDSGYGYVVTRKATFSDTLFFALFVNNTTNTDSCKIFLLDNKGNIIKRNWISRDDPSTQSVDLKIFDNKNYLTVSNIGKYELNAELNNLPRSKKRKQKDYQSVFYEKSWSFDADNDGMDEIVSYNPNSLTFEIFNPGNSNISQVQIPSLFVILKVYPFLINRKVEKLMISTNSGYFFLSYSKNPYYWSKYLIWIAIFITAYTIIFFIQFSQRKRMEAKWETEKQLTELQFNTIRNQLNPHFVFNALSSVGYLIESGKKEEAYDFLSVNTRLIRKVLDDAELTSRSLAAEISFVKDYISIQEFRFKDRFRTTFSIDESVNLQLAVPKMVLHTYIENAVKHGFKNINSGGILEIRIETLPKGVIFTVRDNGHSEDLPVESPENTGKGIKIMESYYRLFEKQHKCRIQTTFTKLNEINPEVTGKEVEIRIEYL